MKKRITRLVAIFATPLLLASSDAIWGVLLNDDDPYFIQANDGTVYEAEWYGGSTLFYEDDAVLLTTGSGWGYLISTSGLSKGSKARVYVEEK